jgi:hypothetical protein
MLNERPRLLVVHPIPRPSVSRARVGTTIVPENKKESASEKGIGIERGNVTVWSEKGSANGPNVKRSARESGSGSAETDGAVLAVLVLVLVLVEEEEEEDGKDLHHAGRIALLRTEEGTMDPAGDTKMRMMRVDFPPWWPSLWRPFLPLKRLTVSQKR